MQSKNPSTISHYQNVHTTCQLYSHNIRSSFKSKYTLLLRNEEFKAEGNLTYNGCNVNEGDAMNVTTGIFTAPRKGIYQLTFHANTV